MRYLFYVTFCLVLCLCVKTFSQNPEWITYLGGNKITDIEFQGDFLWVGTFSGGMVKIDRISGNTTFYDKNNSGLPSNKISCIEIDDLGNKWIGFYGQFNDWDGHGLAVYDDTSWTILSTENSQLPSNSVACISIDGGGNKWIGTHPDWDDENNISIGGGLAKFDGTNWTIYNTSNSELTSNSIKCISIDEEDNKWIATSDGSIAKFDGTNWTIYITFNSDLMSNNINSISIDGDGNTWMATWPEYDSDNKVSVGGGLLKFDGTDWTVYDTSNSALSSNYVYSIEFDRYNNVWIGTREGLVKFNGYSWFNYNDPKSDSPYICYRTAIDENDNKWIGTLGNGLVKFDGTDWIKYSTSSSACPIAGASSMALDKDNNLWFGWDNSNGLAKYDGTDWKIYNSTNLDLPSPIGCIAVDKSNNIWMGNGIGSASGGLAKFDGTNWTVYNTSNSGLPSNWVYSIKIDEFNNVWLSTEEGLVKFDGTDWTVYNSSNSPLKDYGFHFFTIDQTGNKWIVEVLGKKFVKLDSDDTTWTTINPPPNRNFDDIAVDNSNNIWILSHDVPTHEILSLLKFDGTNWTAYDDDTESFHSYFPNLMTIDEHNNIWMGGWNGIGLKKFDGTSWTVYDESNSGIFSDVIEFIETDVYGNIWIGHQDALSVFNENGIVSVEEESTTIKLLPENFTLYQNYPNPLNPSTTIRYSIPQISHVSLRIYDVLGKEVSVLVNQEKIVGSYEIEFNGSDLTSGIYFYRLQAGDYVKTRKMILLK